MTTVSDAVPGPAVGSREAERPPQESRAIIDPRVTVIEGHFQI